MSVGSLSGLSGRSLDKRSVADEMNFDWDAFNESQENWMSSSEANPRTSVELTNTQFLAALDSVSTFANSTKQFVVNLVSVS